ncbi:hypothetical protein BB8028_0006g08340 [Beauveria bassiana]|uniref:Zn(2)-C6 fungal-type domain-containing protein n=1 Tax=Beauveria bassiana TaxID=176275 RepID=A0A2S7YKK0_BEABA|nr:hypothetical protein BB8028_0006g08340 [Beauveria bassiana]
MPGVPSGRACENCRRRRQKCDYAKPTCSRCAHLGVECIGSGQRRFVFIDQKCARRRVLGRKSVASVASTTSSSLQSLSACSSNDAYVLINSFVEMIRPSTARRFNLAWTYGTFLEKVPQRLGSNEALDVAANALVASHRDFATRRPVTPDSLAKYSNAIKALTQSLDDPTESRSLETICAVILLTMCQNLSGLGLQHLNSHCQGAVQMLHLRQTSSPIAEFELDLHTYLQGPVLVQSLFNRSMRLAPSKFEALSRVLAINEDLPGSAILILLFRIPSLMRHGRAVLHGCANRDAFMAELSSTFITLRKAASLVYSKYMMGPSTESKHTGPYGFCLAFSCIFNCMLRGVEPNNHQLLQEAAKLVKDTCDLAFQAQMNRPLGAAHMTLNLSTAWLCANDEHERQMLHTLLGDFNWDFCRDIHVTWSVEDLETLICDIQFKTDPEVVLAHAA